MVTGTVPVVETAPDGCVSAHADCAAPRAPTAPRVAPQTLKCEYTMQAPLGEVVASATVLSAAQITPSRPHVSFLYLCCQSSRTAVQKAMKAACVPVLHRPSITVQPTMGARMAPVPDGMLTFGLPHYCLDLRTHAVRGRR